MLTHSIPIKSEMERLGFLETLPSSIQNKNKNNPSKSTKIVAVDCEMCLTKEGKELTRISLVNESNEVSTYIYTDSFPSHII